MTSLQSDVPWTALRREAKRRFGVERFRSAQKDVLESVFAKCDTLAIMPTGAGKSLTFQLPALFFDKPVLVVSPLIALMQDQQAHAQHAKIDAEKIDSTLTAAQMREAGASLHRGGPGLIYVTPERLENRDFLDELNEHGVSLFVVDEAHTIPQWGHDFRPAYLALGFARKKLGKPPLLALTATATQAVAKEILDVLHAPDARVINAGTERTNLFLAVHATVNREAKLDRIRQMLAGEAGTGILYTSSVRSAEDVYAQLQSEGVAVGKYHGRMTTRARREAQRGFMQDEFRLMVATKAFGLGIDKPDIRFVYHYEFPDSLESYFQEAGRAGRDGKAARAVLLFRLEDRRIQSFFSRGRYPSAFEMDRALAALSDEAPKPTRQVADETGVGQRHAQVTLEVLREAKLVKRKRAGYMRKSGKIITVDEIHRLLASMEERTQHDKARLNEMMHYAESVACRRQLLREYFGEAAGERCGQCDNCVNRSASLIREPASSSIQRSGATEVVTTAGEVIYTTSPETLPQEAVSPQFAVGEAVMHRTFGEGTVSCVEGDTVAVRFGSNGIRKLKSAYVRRTLVAA